MRCTKGFLLIALVGVLILSAFAQSAAADLKINGVVVDKKTGNPLPGANIIIKGTTIGVATDVSGKFELSYSTNKNFVLVVRYMGYKTLEKEFTPTSKLINMTLELTEDIFKGEAVVVTGIASKTSKAIAEVAVSRIDANALQEVQTYDDIPQMLTAKVAGVRVENVGGNPGGGIRFNVRSGGGLNGNEQPVIYVDGVRIYNTEIGGNGSGGNSTGGLGYGTLSELNPEDIESIEILKGPAAAASYGTSGSNGVVLITTKRGKLAAGKGKGVKIDYKYVTGINTLAKSYKDVYPYTYEAVDAVHHDGKINKHTISATGGAGKIRFYVGYDKSYEEGMLTNSWYDRNTLRANVDAYPNNKLVISASNAFTMGVNRRPEDGNNINSYIYNTSRIPNYGWCDSTAISLIENYIKSSRYIGSVQLRYNPIKNMEARFVMGVDNGTWKDSERHPPGYKYSSLTTGDADLRWRTNTQYTYNTDVTYEYNISPLIKVRSIVGAQLYERKYDYFRGEKKGFLTPLIKDIEAAEEYLNLSEANSHYRSAGIFTENSFNYSDLYFFSFMVRKDYASSIGREAPSIIYPKASFALRLDKFGFMPSSVGLLKLRAAYGETGVLPDRLDGIPLLWAAANTPYGTGGQLSAIGNPAIEPERVKEAEFGFEAEVFSKYSMEFTYYRQNANNSIVSYRNAPSTGQIASSIPFNVGKVKGWGIESLIQGRPVDKPNFKIDFTLANSYQTNEVVDMGEAQPIYGSRDVNVIKPGLPKHAFYTWEVVGALFREDGTYWKPKVKEERSYMGVPIPPYTGSFSINFTIFKKFKFYALTEWATGLSLCNYTKRQAIRDSNVPGIRDLEDLLGKKDWYPDKDPAEVGSQEYIDAANEYAHYSRSYKGNFIERADYFKIRELSMSYNVTDLLKKLYPVPIVDNLILGVSMRNVYTITGYSGIDVELNYGGARDLNRGVEFYTNPLPRVISFWARIGI